MQLIVKKIAIDNCERQWNIDVPVIEKANEINLDSTSKSKLKTFDQYSAWKSIELLNYKQKTARHIGESGFKFKSLKAENNRDMYSIYRIIYCKIANIPLDYPSKPPPLEAKIRREGL